MSGFSSSVVFLFLLVSCLPEVRVHTSAPEGISGGECSDGGDNDADGFFDCNDPDCVDSPDCLDTDTDTDADADTDTDSDSDADTDVDMPCFAVPDNGDDVEYAYDLDILSPGVALCGTLSITGNDGDENYIGDLDLMLFIPSAVGEATFELTWSEDSADYDVLLYKQDPLTFITGATNSGAIQPEMFSHTVIPSYQYVVVIGGWSGPSGDWRLTID
ncbi:MAG: hypothetical protein HN348_18145 [Proteobacteria bacterium]|jgi:hypothetical protein|nr:hypothetical protein [Pseudomonadota bacterium]